MTKKKKKTDAATILQQSNSKGGIVQNHISELRSFYIQLFQHLICRNHPYGKMRQIVGQLIISQRYTRFFI